MIAIIALAIEALTAVVFLALFSVAHDTDAQQEPVYHEEKKHSGLLEED